MSPYLAALAILAAGALAGPVLSRRPALGLRVSSAASVAGSLVGLAAVLPFLLGAPPADLVLPWAEPLGSFHLRLDPLSAFFQAALFAVAVPASAFGAGYMKPYVGRRPLGGFVLAYGLLLVAISLVLSAADGVLFLVAWEVMTIASFVLVTFDDERLQVRRAGFVFLVASHVGTAFLFALFLLLGREAGGFDFVRFEALRGGGRGGPLAPLHPRSRGLRDQGRPGPAARLAARGPPGRAEPRLGPPLRGDDQDRRVRAPAPARLPPPARRGVRAPARRHRPGQRAGRHHPHPRSRGSQEGAGLLQRRERRAHRPRGGARRGRRGRRAPGGGGAGAWAARSSTSGTTPS